MYHSDMGQSKTVWIDLFSGAPGLDGPFLLQYHRPYATLRELQSPREDRPQMVMLIGDTSKRLSARRLFGLRNNYEENKVHLHLFRERPGPILLADCELHLLSGMSTVSGGPVLGDRVQRHIRCVPHGVNPRLLATRIYAQLLAPFSTLICIFADDFGGTAAVARFLASWLAGGFPTCAEFPHPRVLVLREWDIFKRGLFDETRALKNFRHELSRQIQGKIRNNDTVIGIELDNYIWKHFDSIGLQAFPPFSREGEASSRAWELLQSRVLADSEEVLCGRAMARAAFSVAHFEAFFYAACLHFAEDMDKPFSFIEASRLTNPVPKDISAHLRGFLEHAIRIKQGELAFRVVASALSIDSYPPDMHRFDPELVFLKLYDDVARQAKPGFYLGPEGLELRDQIRHLFCATVESNFRRKLSSTSGHKLLLARSTKLYQVSYSASICLSCLARAPKRANTLSCRHSFCDPCIIIHGKPRPTDPWEYCLHACPLCQLPNERDVSLKPYTAGVRKLSVRGGYEDLHLVVHFLRCLWTRTPISYTPFGRMFDIATGSGAACAHLVSGIFQEDWPFYDCMRRLKIKSSRSRSRWQRDPGSALRSSVKAVINSNWCPSMHIRYGTKVIRLGAPNPPPYISAKKPSQPVTYLPRECTVVAFPPDAEAAAETQCLRTERAPDILVSCEPAKHEIRKGSERRLSLRLSPDDMTLINFMADNLYASLFYVELVTKQPGMPLFHASPTIGKLRMRCRLPSGEALVDLVMRLSERRATIHYKCNEPNFLTMPALDSDLRAEVRAGGAFVRNFEVEIISPDSIIEVQIDSLISDNRPNISNCPYRLGTLIQDQGLNSAFGHNDHQSRWEVPISKSKGCQIVSEAVERSSFSDSSWGSDDGSTLVSR